MKNLSLHTILGLLLLFLAPSLLAQDDASPGERDEAVTASSLIEDSANLRDNLNGRAEWAFQMLEGAYAIRRTLPLAPESVEPLSLNQTVKLLDAYSEYKNQLVRAYDSLSNEKENTKAKDSLFGVTLEIIETHKRLLALPKSEAVAEELSKVRPLIERLEWRNVWPSALDKHLIGRRGFTSSVSATNAIVLPAAIQIDVHKPQPKKDRALEIALSFDPSVLLAIQRLIDPVEEIMYELEEHKFELEQDQFAAIESQGKAPEEEINEELADHRRTEIRITRYEKHRELTVAEFEDSYFRLLLKASRLGEEVEFDSLIEPRVELSAAAREALEKRAEEVSDEVGKQSAKSMPDLLEELLKSRDELRTKATPGEDLAHTLLREGVLNAKIERINTLRSSIRRQQSGFLVRRKTTQRQVASIALIDERLSVLNDRYFEESLMFYAYALLWALLILFGAWISVRIVKIVAKRIVRSFNADLDHIDQDTEARAKTISVAFVTTFSAAIWVVALLMVLGHFGVNYQPLLVATGGIGLAVGFGAQSLVKDFFSGFFILLENQYTVGDVITIDGKTGTVEQINLRTTRMRSLDGTYHTVPNGQISSVSNMTHKWSRMLVVIGAGYREDPDHVRGIINAVGIDMYADKEWENRLLEPPVVLGLDNLNASSIDFKIVGRTRPGDQWAAEREFRRRVKIQFDLRDIEIPFQYINYVQTKPEKSRVLETPSTTMRKKLSDEATKGGIPDEGAARREADKAKGIEAPSVDAIDEAKTPKEESDKK